VGCSCARVSELRSRSKWKAKMRKRQLSRWKERSNSASKPAPVGGVKESAELIRRSGCGSSDKKQRFESALNFKDMCHSQRFFPPKECQ
jgi:hypothetical protein